MKKNSIKRLMDNFSAAKKSAIVFMIASFISQAMGLITTPIFTRLLTLEEYGISTLFNSWRGILGMLAMLSLSSGVFNVGMNDYREDRDCFVYNMMLLSNTATVIVMAIVFISKMVGFDFTTLSWSILGLMFLYFMLSPAYNFWIARQRYEYKYKASGLMTVLLGVGGALLAILLVVFVAGDKAALKIWGTYLPTIVFGGILYLIFISKNRTINFEYWKFALGFNLPLLLHYLALNIMTGSDRIMIASLVGERQAGIYGLSFTISTIITIVWTALNGSLTPYVFEKLNEKQEKFVNKISFMTLMVYLIPCCIFMLFTPELLRVFATREYSEGVYVMPIIVAACFFQGMYYAFVNVEYYYKKSKYIMAVSIASAMVNIVLNYVGIALFGYLAAAYTTMITNILMCLLHYWNVRRICQRKVFAGWMYAGLGIVCIVWLLLTQFVFQSFVVKILGSLCILIIAFVNRKKLIHILKGSLKN